MFVADALLDVHNLEFIWKWNHTGEKTHKYYLKVKACNLNANLMVHREFMLERNLKIETMVANVLVDSQS